MTSTSTATPDRATATSFIGFVRQVTLRWLVRHPLPSKVGVVSWREGLSGRAHWQSVDVARSSIGNSITASAVLYKKKKKRPYVVKVDLSRGRQD